jgi:hypothetical protein
MDLVKSILDQLTGDSLDKLGAEFGASPDKVRTAAQAAVPTILSSLAGLASSNVGAQKLSSTLGSLDLGKVSSLAGMLGGDASEVTQQGGNLLGSLFGDGLISNITSAISRFAGLGGGATKSLISFLMPLILGKVASAWKSKGGVTSGLQRLFAEQQENIAEAVPSGFSLASIPGLPRAEEAVRAVGRSASAAGAAASDVARYAVDTTHDASRSLYSWLPALAALLLVGLGLWYFLLRPGRAARDAADAAAENTAAAARRAAERTDEVVALRPVSPDGANELDLVNVRDDVTDLFRSMDTAFSDIKDAASAESAMPALEELNSKIDGMNQVFSHLPQASRTSLRPVIEDQVKVVTEKAQAVSSIEGIGPQIKSLIQEIITKITKWISA